MKNSISLALLAAAIYATYEKECEKDDEGLEFQLKVNEHVEEWTTADVAVFETELGELDDEQLGALLADLDIEPDSVTDHDDSEDDDSEDDDSEDDDSEDAEDDGADEE